MSSAYNLEIVLLTLWAATTRIIPQLFEDFSLPNLYDTIVALNPIVTSFWLTIFHVILQLTLSILTRSFAWNDRLWSLLPLPYAIIYSIHPVISSDRRTNGQFDPRLLLMCVLVTIWSFRLTFNAARRGFYTPGFVDYRYAWLQQHIIRNKFLFCICYVFLSCTYFSFMLALAASPLYFAWVARGKISLSWLDIVATISMCCSLLLQTIADNQQHRFQRSKREYITKKTKSENESVNADIDKEVLFHNSISTDELKDGFLQSGVFAWSRHPNFFAEMAVWWSFYLFSVAASGIWLNWSISGPILYTFLFQLSTPLTERISANKYPAYKRYQESTSRLIPSFFSRRIENPITNSKKDN